MTLPDPISCFVITLSDRASRGEYDDLSGPLITDKVAEYFGSLGMSVKTDNEILPDDPIRLANLLQDLVRSKIHVVFTTGGTGLGPRDITPETVRPLLDKEIPGIMELIRVKYGMSKPNALVSRAIAGLADQTLIYCLPGSVKAVTEYCDEILPTILHSLKMVFGMDDHH